MKEIRIHENNGYTVYIGGNTASGILPFYTKNKKILIITDSNVAPLWLDHVSGIVGTSCIRKVITAGETAKSPEALIDIWKILADNGFGRDDAVIALGGGTVGDLAGFAAATYMRGIGFIQMPTTLLSCIDSSVGGKNGINLSGYKNIAGTVRRPSAVICDTEFLSTLPEREIRCGTGELLKYSFACNKEIAAAVQKTGPLSEEAVSMCIRTKKYYAEADENDTGIRHILNFGHTAGHALEALSGFSLSHGEAVAAGMEIVIRAEKNTGLLPADEAESMLETIGKNGLSFSCNYTAEEIIGAMKNDKKRSSGKYTFVLLKKAGDAYTQQMDYAEALCFLRGGLPV